MTATYVQLSIFSEENEANARNEAGRKRDYEHHMRCYRCVMFASHRCRNENECLPGYKYAEYIGSNVRQCLLATVEIYQDGYIHCPIIHSITCEECMKMFENGEFQFDETQNYERKPRWAQMKIREMEV